MKKTVQGEQFLTTSKLCKLLDISVFTLWRRRDEGYFVMGIHYFKTNPEKNISHEFKNNEIFKASDIMVDSLTHLIDRKRAKNLN